MGILVLMRLVDDERLANVPLRRELSEVQSRSTTVGSALEAATVEVGKGEADRDSLCSSLAETKARCKATEAQLATVEEEVAMLRAKCESAERKLRTDRAKHAAEVEKLEEEIAEAARSGERNRAEHQISTAEMLEKRLSAAHDTAQEKLRRSLQATEASWKARLSEEQADKFAVEK